MTELKDDPIYRLLEEHYPNLLLDYAVFSADLPYQGEVSHKEAAMAAILAFSHRHRVGNRYDPGPFTLEPDKMQAERYPAELLFDIPDGSSPVEPGTIRYWYAYAEQPYPTGYTAADFRRINSVLFPEPFRDDLEVFQWNDDFSSYFDDGKYWWGTYFWTIYDKHLQRFVIIGASLID